MAGARATIEFTLDEEPAERARRLNIGVSAAAPQGAADAVRSAPARSTREAHQRMPEPPDPFWSEARARIAEAEEPRRCLAGPHR